MKIKFTHLMIYLLFFAYSLQIINSECTKPFITTFEEGNLVSLKMPSNLLTEVVAYYKSNCLIPQFFQKTTNFICSPTELGVPTCINEKLYCDVSVLECFNKASSIGLDFIKFGEFMDFNTPYVTDRIEYIIDIKYFSDKGNTGNSIYPSDSIFLEKYGYIITPTDTNSVYLLVILII